MEDSHNERAMYRELQGQWSNLQNDNPCVQRNRNQQLHPNNESYLQHQDHLIQNRYMQQQDMYTQNNMFVPNNCDKLNENIPGIGDCHHNFVDNIFINSNTNFEPNNLQSPQNYACIDLGNGNIVKTKVIYNDNNQPQYVLPVNNYELFNPNMRHNIAIPPQCYPMMMNYPMGQQLPDSAALHSDSAPYEALPPRPHEPSRQPPRPDLPAEPLGIPCMPQTYEQQPPSKNHLIDNFLGNWTSNPSGTYTPFGHNFLNVQANIGYRRDPPSTSVTGENCPTTLSPPPKSEMENIKPTEHIARKDPDGILCSEPAGKKRIVAEVKPMRPSYSAVLSKTPKGQIITESFKKKMNGNKDPNKPNIIKSGLTKSDKPRNFTNSDKQTIQNEDRVKRTETRKNIFHSQVSSGSESGEANTEFPMQQNKPIKKNKTKNDNVNRKWVSLDDLSNDNDQPEEEDEPRYTNCDSEFVFVTPPDEKANLKKRNIKKSDGNIKKSEKSDNHINQNEPGIDDSAQFVFQEPLNDPDKFKRKKEGRSSYSSRSVKSAAERNKKNVPIKNKKTKGASYMAILQAYVDSWMVIMKSIIIWFYNLLSDIFRMSIQLSGDLFSFGCKNTYTWSVSVWMLIKEQATNTQWLCNAGTYIDKKLGHTRFGFWRKLKWLKNNNKPDDEAESLKKSNTNIPLPATGDDAMKRLLACKGKDPYSILGVGVQCTDDDIKRYYRRQAFLVHPDKNQQPGAEEAFKILQHAFDLIGEPERREAYDRKLLESRHVEAAWSELSELLAQLHDKVRHAAGTIRCTNCSRRHKRTLTARPCYAARYCAMCKIHHSAKEGDIWAESNFWGLVWMYYACMDGAVYQITQWASCQRKNLKHLKANTHHVQYRIVLGNKSQPSGGGGSGKQTTNSSSHDANLEDFLNNLYTKAGQTPGPGPAGKNMPTPPSQAADTAKNKRKTKKTNKL